MRTEGCHSPVTLLFPMWAFFNACGRPHFNFSVTKKPETMCNCQSSNSTLWKGSSAGSDPYLLVPLPVQHPSDWSGVVPGNAAEPQHKHVRQINMTPVTPQGSTTPCTLPSGPWVWCHVYALESSQCCLVFPFPPPPTVSLPSLSLPTPPPNVSSCTYLDGAMHSSKNVFNRGAVWGPREERHVDKALGRKSAVWLLHWPAVWLKASPI